MTNRRFRPAPERLLGLYQSLFDRYGPQHWWPADSPFEVMVGAVLTQNTAWSNVEKAIEALKQHRSLSLDAMLAMPVAELARLIRPAGYFNLKAQRLRHLLEFLQQTTIEGLRTLPTDELRRLLLAVHGIGPETADDILLYAFERPVFVIDAYTRRLLRRTGLLRSEPDYEVLRAGFERALPADVALFNEYHALIVHHAKQHCSARRPLCDGCPAAESCRRVGVSG